jgi:succinate dehydrogenase / fumarate reductase iron-sulfur subunit
VSGEEGTVIIYTLRIKRQKSQSEASYWQDIEFHCEEGSNETIATALTKINQRTGTVDTSGSPVGEIFWECSCLQKKCGACAMVINGRPGLACDTFLKNYKVKRPIVIEPLRKFPVIRDLIVDRSIMRENLKTVHAWMEGKAAPVGEKQNDRMYDASRCLQCGCCLEVCPNFCGEDAFFGAAAAVPVSRLIQAMGKRERETLKKSYQEHLYSGCGKSLACIDICPAKIDIGRTLSSTNALAIWKK